MASRTPHVFIALLAAIGLSCSSPNADEVPLIAPGGATPVATGLLVTTRYGPEIIGVWRRPQFVSRPLPDRHAGAAHAATTTEDVPTSYYFHAPYANPSNDSIQFSYALPAESKVTVWIVPARWAGDADPDIGSVGGAVVSQPSSRAVRTFARNESQSAGHRRLVWDFRGDDGSPVTAGFYRVFVAVDALILWHDVLYFHSPVELPPDLRTLVELRDQW